MTNVTLVGHHFPKTGGSSVLSHAASYLHEGHYYSFGPHGNTKRLYSEKALLAEFPPEKSSELRFVFGHGVDFSTLAHLSTNEVALFAICRHTVRAAARDGELQRARGLLISATQLNASIPQAWYWLARVSRDLGDQATAEHAISMALKLNPNAKKMLNLQAAVSSGRPRDQRLQGE